MRRIPEQDSTLRSADRCRKDRVHLTVRLGPRCWKEPALRYSNWVCLPPKLGQFGKYQRSNWPA